MSANVKEYSGDMIDIAEEYFESNLVFDFYTEGFVSSPRIASRAAVRPAYWLGVGATVPLSVYFFGNVFFHITGLFGGAFHRIMDYVSSKRVLKEFDEKFFEYGLDEYIQEANKALGKHPTEGKLKKYAKLREPPILVACTLMPAVGHSLAADAVPIYLHHSKVAKTIKVAKKVGDIVKYKLDNGLNESGIKDLLDELYDNPNRVDDYYKLINSQQNGS